MSLVGMLRTEADHRAHRSRKVLREGNRPETFLKMSFVDYCRRRPRAAALPMGLAPGSMDHGDVAAEVSLAMLMGNVLRYEMPLADSLLA